MAANELLCKLAGIKPSKLTKEENMIIEAELFSQLCEKLKNWFINNYIEYFRLIKFDREKEMEMFENNFSRCIINDILATEEYTLSGIAQYTQTPEEIVFEIINGNISNPSVTFFRKIIELHRSVRSDLYRAIMDKIVLEYSA